MLLYFLQDQKTDASAHYFVDKYSNSQKLLNGTNLFSRVCLGKKLVAIPLHRGAQELHMHQCQKNKTMQQSKELSRQCRHVSCFKDEVGTWYQ